MWDWLFGTRSKTPTSPSVSSSEMDTLSNISTPTTPSELMESMSSYDSTPNSLPTSPVERTATRENYAPRTSSTLTTHASTATSTKQKPLVDLSFLNFLSLKQNNTPPQYKTSHTHPLDIELVPEDIMERIAFKSACLGIHMCPGRNKRLWKRDLHADIQRLKEMNIDCVVTLVREVELESMKIGAKNYFETLQAHGLETYHYPIRDKFIPMNINELCVTVDWIRQRLSEGKQITVHCNGGKGRAGTITACLLVSCGIDPVESIRIVQTFRGGSLRNPLQQIYIRRFKSAWDNFIKTKARLETSQVDLMKDITQKEEAEDLLDLETVCVNMADIDANAQNVFHTESFHLNPDDTNAEKMAITLDESNIEGNLLDMSISSENQAKDIFDTEINLEYLENKGAAASENQDAAEGENEEWKKIDIEEIVPEFVDMPSDDAESPSLDDDYKAIHRQTIPLQDEVSENTTPTAEVEDLVDVEAMLSLQDTTPLISTTASDTFSRDQEQEINE